MRERENIDRDNLAGHVTSRSNSWQKKCCVAMAKCLFNHPRVTGQGSIIGVIVVQEAVEIRALISQHCYQGEEWELSLRLFGTGTSVRMHTHTHTHAPTHSYLMHK